MAKDLPKIWVLKSISTKFVFFSYSDGKNLLKIGQIYQIYLDKKANITFTKY